MPPRPESLVPHTGPMSRTEFQLQRHRYPAPWLQWDRARLGHWGAEAAGVRWPSSTAALLAAPHLLYTSPEAPGWLHMCPCYFKNHHTLLALHFKFKGQENTIKHKAIIPRSSQSPAISKQSRVWIIERPVSAGYESMKEGSPEPAHNSQPVGKLP